jgi:two-component system CheB/CheR fusion protein
VFRGDLRRSVIFGRHDLVQDAPISRLDLLVCRNALMYFNAELQSRILLRFHFGLGSPGYLFLGKAEMLLAHADLFRPFDFQHRMFEKIPRPTMRERFVVLSNNSGRHADHPRLIVDEPTLAELAIDAWPDACMIVDRQGNLAQINAQARMKFRLLPADVGRPLSDFPISTVPVELGPRIAQAIRFQSPVIVKDVSFQNESGDLEMVDVRVTPLGPARRPLGVCITYRSTHGATRPIPDDPKTSSDLSSEGGK